MAIYEYTEPLHRYSWFDEQDVIEDTIAEAVPEGGLVSRNVSTLALCEYDPDVAVSVEKPLGVVVNHAVEADGLANVAVRGTFGDIFVTVNNVEETFNGDDDGGAAGGKKVAFTLDREVVEILSVEVAAEDSADTAYTELEAADYSVDGMVLTILSADNAPLEGSTQTETLKITYNGKPNASDRAKFEPAVIINPVVEYEN